MLQAIILVSLMTAWTEPAFPGPKEELRGSWAVIAERTCSDRCNGMSTWERGEKGPTLVIADDTVSYVLGKKKAVYALHASATPKEYHLTLLERVGLSAQDTPPKLTCSLDGDVLKVCWVPDVDDAVKSSEEEPELVPGLPPYHVITVHPYWKHVQFLAKRSKP